jgi:hypothetical protein
LLIGTALNGGVNEGSSVLNSRGAGNGQFLFQTDGTTRMTLTDTGNLGLGVTPSAVSVGDRVVQVRNFLFNDNTNGYGILRYNNFFNGTSDVYLNTGAVSAFQMQGNAFKWYQAASGTAGNTITFTQAMTLQASGGLSVGTTTDPGAGNIGLAASKGISFISGGFIASSQGQITVSGGTTTTFVTLSNANENRTYLVSVRQSGSQNNYVVGFATSYGANASIKRMVQDNAGGVTDMDFAISGLNLQLVLGAGFGSTTWDYIVTRLS